ncbi:MAG: M14 family metallopeptidase [Bacteroidetes bacterium]|nr:M14 family metallopeptidase [Bacteroidota bacterium]
MYRKSILFLGLWIGILCANNNSAVAQSGRSVQSPDDFLGYKTGSRFTPHWKIVSYFQHVAAAMPAMVKLEQYGETNEGRPLLLAFISTPENIKNLGQIQMNNLRLANLSKDKAAPVTENAPAIVWLSYNVHGNETSSSEAAMMTLYAMVNPTDTKYAAWLKNTVVIIDPCLNPDGRDRYVNWYNSVVGKNNNPLRMAREHREPWPGGRTNHYNFDLNRDWAWQTQVESRQRLKVYQQWMPQVHVDFHEQGVNEPYYFAPAAQPYHDVITPWQRDFQVTIGKNHAKYFDANGWLYFTKEVFDLYYPSYGDTYPIYSGAIGMTYEQGGGPSGGSAIINDEGDTLTLYDRMIHHYTTSLSTIEIASLNANKLVTEFRKFYNESLANGNGEYKTYVIKNNPKDRERISALIGLLDKNGIEYSSGAGNGKGFQYNSGKEENFTLNNDLVISALQPRSALVKVLFEPRGKLVDTVTYDITAWSLPYAYGLEAWACKDKISGNGPFSIEKPVSATTTYGYVIPWNGIRTVKLAAQLLKKGILLRYAEQPFEVNGNKFDRGAIIVLKTANKSWGNALFETVQKAADAEAVRIYAVSTGYADAGYDFGSDKVHPFRAPRIVLLTGEGVSSYGAGEIWHFFDQEIQYPITLVNASDAANIRWNETDVLIMPDGNYRFLNDKAQTDAFKDWINKGGHVVALEGAVSGLAKADIGIRSKRQEDAESGDSNNPYTALKKYEDRDRLAVSGGTPGSIYRVEMDNTHPLAFGYGNYYYTLKMDDKVYEFFKDNGWNVGVIKKDNQVAGFVGARLKDKLKDGLLFGVQNMGNGSITYLADNPMFRSFWESGKLMFCNAVFLVGN